MPITVLPRSWDSTFFGVRVAEVQAHGGALHQALEEAAWSEVECLYLFVDAADLMTIETAVRRCG